MKLFQDLQVQNNGFWWKLCCVLVKGQSKKSWEQYQLFSCCFKAIRKLRNSFLTFISFYKQVQFKNLPRSWIFCLLKKNDLLYLIWEEKSEFVSLIELFDELDMQWNNVRTYNKKFMITSLFTFTLPPPRSKSDCAKHEILSEIFEKKSLKMFAF